MQTSITDFLKRSDLPETLPFADTVPNESALKKRCRNEGYIDTYPLRSSFSRSAASHLRLIDARLFSRHHTRPHYAVSTPPPECFRAKAPPKVLQVTSSLHLNRTSEDGESLISSVETFKNCITEIVWDPKDEFFIATRRSRFQLFGASSLLRRGEEHTGDLEPLLNLKASTVQPRLGAESRISFGLVTAQFLGNTLNTICSYSGTPHIDVFDLEDLDEDAGQPLCTFDLNSLFEHNAHSTTSTPPSATAIVTVSDKLAIAALSNGICACVDTRSRKTSVCTRPTAQSDILNSFGSLAGRKQQRRHNSAVDVVSSGCSFQLVTGTKSGLVELWDLRRFDKPIVSTSVGGAVEMIKVPKEPSSRRCGAPTLWLNTDAGELLRLSIGAASFETICQTKTNDTRRSRSSANLAPPKLSTASQSGLLIYPHVASNSVLFYEMDDLNASRQAPSGVPAKIDAEQHGGPNLRDRSAGDDFKTARSLLLQQESVMYGDASFNDDPAPKARHPVLLQSLAFHEWSSQISSVAAANRHDAVAVGGDDGDVHLILDSEA